MYKTMALLLFDYKSVSIEMFKFLHLCLQIQMPTEISESNSSNYVIKGCGQFVNIYRPLFVFHRKIALFLRICRPASFSRIGTRRWWIIFIYFNRFRFKPNSCSFINKSWNVLECTIISRLSKNRRKTQNISFRYNRYILIPSGKALACSTSRCMTRDFLTNRIPVTM